ncbi:MAG: PEGA domain-containing protein [Anaeromyxobacter sp.]
MSVHPRALLPTLLLAALCAGPAGAHAASPRTAQAAPAPAKAATPPLPMPDKLQEQLDPPGAKENVWSRGVPEAERQAAEKLFYEGNGLMRESITHSAIAKYREAMKHWDHPNIHYNISVALMTLDQPVETYKHLQDATKYGPTPLEQERYEHALNYLALLRQQLAHVRVTCPVPGAQLDVDGNPVLVTPGTYEALVRAGQHSIAARKEGYVSNESTRVLEGGKLTEITLELKTVAELTETQRRFPVWVPWTIAGTGVAVAAVGGVFHYSGNQKIDDANQYAIDTCLEPDGCPAGEPAHAADLREQGEKYQKVAAGAYVVGGVAIGTGIVMALFNGTETRVRGYDNPGAPAKAPKVAISPLVTPDAPGLSVAWRF